MGLRIGQGVDIHRYGSGDGFVLGAVRIPHSAGVIAHSDGDALLHAVADALLGAVALGDIGSMFPDSDARYEDIDSSRLLAAVVARITDRGFRAINLDATVVAEEPILGPYVPPMRDNIAALVGLDRASVSVKATRAERLGALGAGKGLMALCTVLLEECA